MTAEFAQPHAALDRILKNPEAACGTAAWHRPVLTQRYDRAILAGQVRELYDELIHEKQRRK